MSEPEPASEPPDREPDPGQGLDSHRVRVGEPSDVTDDQLGIASFQQRAGSPTERRDVLGRDRTADDQEGMTPVSCHPMTRPDRAGKLSAGTDEFGPTVRS